MSSDEPYPFESDDDIEIRELDLEDVDALGEDRITVGELAGVNESWRYGHVIVDEAQDLTPMQWRMVMRRVRGQSLTIVGDLAQRSAGSSDADDERWESLLPPELAEARRQDLTVNYRSPAEIHRLATAVLADFAPSVAPSIALRSSGFEPAIRSTDDLGDEIDRAVDDALAAVGGLVAVIGADSNVLRARIASNLGGEPSDNDGSSRVRFLTPNESKGLEFDAVVLVEPDEIWRQDGGAAQLYIALTRATQRLLIVHERALPKPLRPTG